MDGALAWIGQIIEWFGRFIPRLEILNPTMVAAKYCSHWWGPDRMTTVICGPGAHVYWPFMTEWDPYPIQGQVDDLRTQSITTADDVTITVAGMLVYEIDDAMKLLPRTHDPVKLIKAMTLAAIHDVCNAMSWEQLREGQRKGTLDTKLRNEAKKVLEPYGVKVIRVQLTDMARARVIKMIQAVGKDEE